MAQIAYLIASPYITNTGKLYTKSLRAFEVEYTIDTSNAYWHRAKITSTGKVFVLKDNTIVEKRTKAKLANKYVRSGEPTSNITDVPSWNSRLFTSPELALLAKSVAIKSRVQSRISKTTIQNFSYKAFNEFNHRTKQYSQPR